MYRRSRRKRKVVFERSIEALFREYEKKLDAIDSKEKELGILESAYQTAVDEYKTSKSLLQSRIEGLTLESDELREAMEILGDRLD